MLTMRKKKKNRIILYLPLGADANSLGSDSAMIMFTNLTAEFWKLNVYPAGKR